MNATFKDFFCAVENRKGVSRLSEEGFCTEWHMQSINHRTFSRKPAGGNVKKKRDIVYLVNNHIRRGFVILFYVFPKN
jgi:hypothetical protein